MPTKRDVVHRKPRKARAWAMVFDALRRATRIDDALPEVGVYERDVLDAYRLAKNERSSTEAVIAVAALVKAVYAAGFIHGKEVGKAQAAEPPNVERREPLGPPPF